MRERYSRLIIRPTTAASSRRIYKLCHECDDDSKTAAAYLGNSSGCRHMSLGVNDEFLVPMVSLPLCNRNNAGHSSNCLDVTAILDRNDQK